MRSIPIASWPFSSFATPFAHACMIRCHGSKPLSATSAGCCPKPLPRRLLPRASITMWWRRWRWPLAKPAHGPVRVSLMAGQGASLALAGGRTLGQVLDGEADIAAALARFEQRLRSLVGKAARRAAHGQMVRAGQSAPRRHPRHVSQHHDLAAAIGPAESFLLIQLQGLFTGFPLTL